MTDDQKAMQELLEAYAIQRGMSLIGLLGRYRHPGEPVADLIERVYKEVEDAESRQHG